MFTRTNYVNEHACISQKRLFTPDEIKFFLGNRSTRTRAGVQNCYDRWKCDFLDNQYDLSEMSNESAV